MYIKKVCLTVFFLFNLYSGAAFAEVFKTVLIYLPGNFQGKTISYNQPSEIIFSDAFKLPALIKKLRKNSAGRSTDFYLDVGNNFNVNQVTSFCTNGLSAETILQHCDCDARSVSDQDLLKFRSKILSAEIRDHILTNLEYPDNYSIFKPFKLQKKDGVRLWLFTFISPGKLSALPLNQWGQFKPENPSRSLRRIAPDFRKTDISISVAYLDNKECVEIEKQLCKFPGSHIVLQVADSADKKVYSDRIVSRTRNVFSLSLPDPGIECMPFIKINRSSSGYLTMKINSFRLADFTSMSGAILFKNIEARIKKSLFETLTFVPVTIRPSTAPFRFNSRLYADMSKEHCRTDIAIILPPEEAHKTDNVVDTATCLSSFKNEKLYSGHISGKKLIELVNAVVKNFAILPEFSGVTIDVFAGQPESVKTGINEISYDANYSFCINAKLINHPAFPTGIIETGNLSFSGITLWDVWQTQLKSLRMNKTHFMEL